MFQLRLRRAVIESGEFYLVQSRIDGRPVLRTTMMNPLTTDDDLRGLIECLRRFGRQLLVAGSDDRTSDRIRNPKSAIRNRASDCRSSARAAMAIFVRSLLLSIFLRRCANFVAGLRPVGFCGCAIFVLL